MSSVIKLGDRNDRLQKYLLVKDRIYQWKESKEPQP